MVAGNISQNVRPGPNGFVHKGIFPSEKFPIFRPVLRNDLEAELGKGVQNGPLEGKLDRVVVDLGDALDKLKPNLEGSDGFGMHHDIVGEDDILGGKRLRFLALLRMPCNILPQVKGVPEAIIGDLHSLGELRDNFLLFIYPDEAVKNQLADSQ